jgi:protein SCO1/2
MDQVEDAAPDGFEARPSSPFLDWVRKYIWWIGGIGGLVTITAMRPFLIHRPPPPPVIAQLPAEFALIDQNGDPFTPASMQGEVYVVGFMFTRCPSLCPQITAAMQRFETALEDGGIDEHVRLLSVSIDPEYDTPEKLREYADAYGITQSNWTLVTAADEAETEAFVVGGFKLAIGDKTEVEPGVYDIAHSSKLALVDREGGIRGVYSIEPEGLEELYHRALAIVRDD